MSNEITTRLESTALVEMPLSLAFWFDDRIFSRASSIAGSMSKAVGFVPQHLIGQPDACLAIVEFAFSCRLSPYAVARATYKTPNGQIGYMGKLCAAIIEASGRIDGQIRYDYHGDWSRVQGKFRTEKREKTNRGTGEKYSVDVLVPAWTDADEAGLGVTVSATLKGEDRPRSIRIDFVQANPRNSTLWTTDPKTQLGYLAVRRFGDIAVPSLFFGAGFNEDEPSWQEANQVLEERPRRGRPPKVVDAAATVADPSPIDPVPPPSSASDGLATDGSTSEGGDPDVGQPWSYFTVDGVTEEFPGDELHLAVRGFEQECADTASEGIDRLQTLVGYNAAFLAAVEGADKGVFSHLQAKIQSLLDAKKKREIRPLTGKNGINWMAWGHAMIDAVGRASTRSELDDISRDNSTHMKSIPSSYSSLLKTVDKALSDKRASLPA